MGIVMNMSSYEIEHDGSPETEYGDEVLCAGWNPVLALACQQHQFAREGRGTEMPASLAAADAELFLRKMYAFQR